MERAINLGLWKKVKENAAKEKRPIFVLAPMADVTDAAFRRIIAKYSRMGKARGGPDVMWTEFVSADGLCSPGREVLLRDLAFTEAERPIVAQLFTSHPEKMKGAAALVASLGFDGLDINMGCPDRSIEKQAAGAAMMKDPKAAIAVIQAAREGVRLRGGTLDARGPLGGAKTIQQNRAGLAERERGPSTGRRDPRAQGSDPEPEIIPVSVKTRIGYNKIEIDTWIRALLEQKLAVLTVHLRTRKEMSDVPAHWELMPDIVKLRDEISPDTIIIGNGDVMTLDEAREKTEKYGCDGVMFGRAIFGNPWLFDRDKELENRASGRGAENFFGSPLAGRREVSAPASSASRFFEGRRLGNKEEIAERLRVLVEHTGLFMELFKGVKSFAVMKKHYKAYVHGWPACRPGRDGAKELRAKLMDAENAEEVKEIVERYLAEKAL